MNHYLFIFGNTPELSRAELYSVLSRLQYSFTSQSLDSGIESIKATQQLNIQQLNTLLGGVVKIAIVCDTTSTLSPDILAQILSENSTHDKRITFGISLYSKYRNSSLQLATEVKKLLKKKGVSSRFVASKEGDILSSVVVEKQHIHEFITAECKGTWIIAQTQAVQNFSAWSSRDYDRPHARPKRGMLPPKVARMMINIGLGKKNLADTTMLDPFCGMGTILAEAALLGVKSFGIDIDQISVTKAQKNTEWLYKQTKLLHSPVIICGDATHVDQVFPNKMFDCIITEPYLGPAFSRDSTGAVLLNGKKVTKEKQDNSIRGLQKLYLGSIKNWYSLLRRGGKIVIALPIFRFSRADDRSTTTVVKKVIDKCENLGYTLVAGPFIYSRKQAIVQRAIYVFEKS